MLIDIAFSFVMIIAVFKGYSKGLVVGIFSLLAFIIGIAAALKLSAIVAQYLEDATSAPARWLPVISFMLVFIAVVLLVHIGARIIKKSISLAMLGWVDRLGGIVLYMVLYTIIFSILLFFAEKTSLLKPETVASSSAYHFIAPWGGKVINSLGEIVPLFKNLFTELQAFFEKIGSRITA